MRWVVLLAVWFCVVAVRPPAAHADRKSVTPWSKDVSEADQKRALELFHEGSALHEQDKYADAVDKYEQALRHWDNPSIHFNMALCLINMRQMLLAWQHLEKALRFKEEGLGKRLFTEAMSYRAVLESSLADLTVRWEQPEIKVMVDGAEVVNGKSKKLLPGSHQLVASRPGYTPLSRALVLPAGKPDVEEVALELEKVKVQRDNYERRWAWWVPWSVEGGAVALALVAAGIYVSADNQIKNFDVALKDRCPMGCMVIPSDLQHVHDSARTKSGVAIGMWVGAGAVAIGGGVMAIMNRPIKVERRAVTPTVAVSRDYVGAAITFSLE